jgi:membrane protein
LNTAYDVQETRPWIKQQMIRVVAFVISGVIMGISTVVFLDGEVVLSWIGRALDVGSAVILAWKILQFPLAFAGLVGLAFMTFYLLPNLKQRKAHVLLAAVATTILWILATLLFRLYVNHFPPNPTYGLIGGVIILLSWMYYTMLVVLIGGELASELHHGSGAIAPDKGGGGIYVGQMVSGTRPGSPSVGRGAR